MPMDERECSLTVMLAVDLKKLCRGLGLAQSGTKADNIKSILNAKPEVKATDLYKKAVLKHQTGSLSSSQPVVISATPPHDKLLHDRCFSQPSSSQPASQPLASTSYFLPTPAAVSAPFSQHAAPRPSSQPLDIEPDEFDDEFDSLPIDLTLDALDEIDAMSKGDMHPKMAQATSILKEVFGYDAFRLKQYEVVERLLCKKENALVLFPTGGGKSLCFQVPALCLPGLTVVISPLISLMKDQVDVLKSKGVAAAALDSTLTLEETLNVKNQIKDNKLKILYCAPERLENEGFHELIKSVKVSMLAVDESHCVSEWGASFRPVYLKVSRFAKEIEAERVLCLTATATPKVAIDICESFHIDPKHGVFKTPVFRPNLSLNVVPATSLAAKLAHLTPILKANTSGPAIIYVGTQKDTETIAFALQSKGLGTDGRGGHVRTYHGGMASAERMKVQDAFMASKNDIVVATIAFGMGVDKSNIRIVAHLYFSKSLESYSQEVGRAGRDGLPSSCYIYLQNQDIPMLEGFARGDTCSVESIQGWLEELCEQEESAGDPGVIDVSAYHQSEDYDIRTGQLAILYSQLELDFGMVKALTSAYATYMMTPTATYNNILSDMSLPAQAVFSHKKVKSIDVYEASRLSGVRREDIQRKINSWEINGNITVKASSVRNRYAKTVDLPDTPESRMALAQDIYELAIRREEADIARLATVIAVMTAPQCLARSLSQHFGDELNTPTGTCTLCTLCRNGGQPVNFPAPLTFGQIVPIPQSVISAVLAEVPSRDDPRFLARFAFGIHSPRIRTDGLSKSRLFGSLDDYPFDSLLAAFRLACTGYPTTRPPKKIRTVSKAKVTSLAKPSAAASSSKSTSTAKASSSGSTGAKRAWVGGKPCTKGSDGASEGSKRRRGH